MAEHDAASPYRHSTAVSSPVDIHQHQRHSGRDPHHAQHHAPTGAVHHGNDHQNRDRVTELEELLEAERERNRAQETALEELRAQVDEKGAALEEMHQRTASPRWKAEGNKDAFLHSRRVLRALSDRLQEGAAVLSAHFCSSDDNEIAASGGATGPRSYAGSSLPWTVVRTNVSTEELAAMESQGSLGDVLAELLPMSQTQVEIHTSFMRTARAVAQRRGFAAVSPRDAHGARALENRTALNAASAEELESLYQDMRSGDDPLPIRDRRIGFTLHRSVFSGRDLVEWMLAHVHSTDSRAEAVDLGQRLMDAHFFHHITSSEPLLDSHSTLYRFQEDEKKHVLNMNKIFDGPSRSASEIAYDLFKQLIEAYTVSVAEEGRFVDYERFMKTPQFARLSNTLAELQRLDMSALSHDEKLALLINVYNVLVIHGLSTFGAFQSNAHRHSFFRTVSYSIGGLTYSLDDIEHGLLRGNKRSLKKKRQFDVEDERRFHVFHRPQIHALFALFRGCVSSPPLRVYSTADVVQVTKFAAQLYCEDHVEVHEKRREVVLPRPFEKYDELGADPRAKVKQVMELVSDDKRKALQNVLQDSAERWWGSLTVRFQKFDWTLNSIHLEE